MKQFFLLILLCFLSISSYSQIGGEDEVYLNGDFTNPIFNGGGLDKFYEFVNKNFDFSKVKQKGKMVAAFTVNENGEVKGIKIIDFLDIESATEMIRVLKLSPKWISAKRGGKPVSVELKLPLDFKNEVDNSENPKMKTVKIENHKNNNDGVLLVNALEAKPEFTGGLKSFYKYIGDNFRVPTLSNFRGGKLIVSFVINTDGKLSDFTIVKDLGFGTSQEAIRVLQNSPRWTPGSQKGIPVRCLYTLPITIKPN